MLKHEKGAATPRKALAPKQHRNQFYREPVLPSRAEFAMELAAQLLFDLQKPLSCETHDLYVRLLEGHLRRYASLKVRECTVWPVNAEPKHSSTKTELEMTYHVST